MQDKRRWYRETFDKMADDLTIIEAWNNLESNFNKPKQYRKGIDTFERMRRNMSIEGIKNTTTATVDAYIWRDKGSDYEDFCKARDWLNFCIEAMEEHNKKENK